MSESAEAVALRLLEMLMQHDEIAAEFKEKPGMAARKWLLTTYGECFRSVLGAKDRKMKRGPGRSGESDASEARSRKSAPVPASADD